MMRLRQTRVSTILIDIMDCKLSFVAYALTALCVGVLPDTLWAQTSPEPAVPVVSDTHREFLSRIARRTVRDATLDRGGYEPGYVPAALDSLVLEAVVRLRDRGYLRAAGVGGPAPISRAVRDAAPFPPFPHFLGLDTLTVQIVFELDPGTLGAGSSGE